MKTKFAAITLATMLALSTTTTSAHAVNWGSIWCDIKNAFSLGFHECGRYTSNSDF